MTCNCNLNGGMALTAEQVDGLKFALEAVTSVADVVPELRRTPSTPISRLVKLLRALFPATEPAEERCQKWTLGDSKIMDVIQCVLPAGHECFHDYVQPAPAEPAEEETKAEECAVRLCVLPARHSGVHADREGLRWNNPAPSPVVPAPTETGPWA